MRFAIGMLLLTVGVFGGFVLHGGSLHAIWQPTELMIIFGAGLGALVISNPMHVLRDMWVQIRWVVFMPKQDGQEFQRQLLLLLYELLEMVKDGGLKALDGHVDYPEDSALFGKYPLIQADHHLVSFIVDNFRLMAMGKISPHELEGMLDQELMAIEEELLKPARSLGKVGEAMPGFGILAAVLGIVTTMGNIGESMVSVGVQIAAAMVGTFIGILMCYGILEPLSSAMVSQVQKRFSALVCVKVVLCAQLAGKPTLLAVDAGRKLIPLEMKPSFAKLESWIMEV
ncbi:flagellar motor stator protein MotA [Chromobacterium haemolyticum]|uniref:flagellar motor stator protein MotA n=1 Tax=Chromobacterium haemolyticum TaxID=394935 RepID=UPI0009D9E4FF|nr:flagellar motor stator protein MotA [Chromobacterium haemolyticum]OQS33854.1 flagellar motor stator protein MotA [Chromobacterium haemolyticum]